MGLGSQFYAPGALLLGKNFCLPLGGNSAGSREGLDTAETSALLPGSNCDHVARSTFTALTDPAR